ncbi:hypothetical protein ABZS66_12725 [Dactylosporangium sp. NPDC005572]|uniref:hypothetical protein n=1 Tax=Dactylosporangium sp. NPDC005572 TaxID=3156889 RepID=UPI0033B58AFF
MSTYSGLAIVDLDGDPDPFLAALATRDPVRPVQAWIRPAPGGGTRVTLFAEFGNEWLAPAVTAAGGFRRASISLDHSSEGVEHLVLDATGHAVQHVDVGPSGETPASRNDPSAWTAVAALYGVEVAAVAAAGRTATTAHHHLTELMVPFDPFWEAVGIEEAIPDGFPDRELRS